MDIISVEFSMNRINHLHCTVPAEQDEWEIEQLRKIITMPYIYYVAGLGSEYFWLYVEKYMEVGDVLEIISIFQQDETDIYVQKMLDNPEPIHIKCW